MVYKKNHSLALVLALPFICSALFDDLAWLDEAMSDELELRYFKAAGIIVLRYF